MNRRKYLGRGFFPGERGKRIRSSNCRSSPRRGGENWSKRRGSAIGLQEKKRLTVSMAPPEQNRDLRAPERFVFRTQVPKSRKMTRRKKVQIYK